MKGKNAIITGCSRGIGLETVKALLNMDWSVYALSRDARSLKDLAGEKPRLQVFETDICDAARLDQSIDSLKEKLSKVDLLVHNAGALMHKPFYKTTTEDFMEIYKVNVFAVAELTRKLLPLLKQGSHVLAIGSVGGVQGSVKFAGLSAYSSSKGALITLMELLAEEYKEKGIHFNTLALGAVQTEMLKTAFPDYQAPTSAEEMGLYVAQFGAQQGHMFNGKIIEVSNSTP